MKDKNKPESIMQIASKSEIDMAELADWSEIDALQRELLQIMVSRYNSTTDDTEKEQILMCIRSMLGIPQPS